MDDDKSRRDEPKDPPPHEPGAEEGSGGSADVPPAVPSDDDSALGALSAGEARNRNDLVIVGYDATPEAVKAIQRGSALKADVAQQRLQHPQGRRGPLAPVGQVAELPPPERLGVPALVIVPQTV